VKTTENVRALAGGIARNVKQLRRNLSELDSQPGPDPIVPAGMMRAILRTLGRPIVCSECGRTMFVALPVVWRGQIWMIGAYGHLFHVTFASSERIEFRHAQLDECPAPSRPWVP